MYISQYIPTYTAKNNPQASVWKNWRKQKAGCQMKMFAKVNSLFKDLALIALWGVLRNMEMCVKVFYVKCVLRVPTLVWT